MNFREIFFNKIFSLKNLFLFGNFLLLILCFVVLAQDFFREWKPYQKEYNRLDRERIEKMMQEDVGMTEEAFRDELRAVRSRNIEIKQILATDLHRVDRCITCHVGHDSLTNPAMTNEFKKHPYAAPKNLVHEKHAFEDYGCTVCHEGQGLATTFVGAGHMPVNEEQKAEWEEKHHWEVVDFWQNPISAGPLIYASCSKCHAVHPEVPGMEIIKNGEQTAFEYGCVGCHQIGGEGGTIAPDLALETSVKPITRIDFGNAVTRGLITKNERTLENWIRLHFSTAPAVLTPGDPEGKMSPDPSHPEPVPPSAMPYFGFSKEETESLVAFVMSLKAENVPYTYRVFAPEKLEPRFANAAAHGRYVFQKYGCTGCHGKNADKGIEVYNKQGGTVPDLVKTVGTFSREELIKKIRDGVNPEEKEDLAGPTPPLYMPDFKEKIKGKELDNLVTYLFSIAIETEEW